MTNIAILAAGMMDDSMMMACMVASAIFALVVLTLLIVQTVTQVRILRAVRERQAAKQPAPRNGGMT